MDEFKNISLPEAVQEYMTELQVRNLIAAALANYTGVVRFQTLVSTTTTITDFTNSQHNHQNAAGGGQLNPSSCFSSIVPVSQGGTGVNTITGILKGSGASALTAIVPLAGTKIYYVSDTNGGVVNRRLTFTDGILTSET